MKELVSQIYERIQTLDMPPIRSNVEKMLQTMIDLQTIYKYLEEGEKKDGVRTEAREKNHPEGWNNV